MISVLVWGVAGTPARKGSTQRSAGVGKGFSLLKKGKNYTIIKLKYD